MVRTVKKFAVLIACLSAACLLTVPGILFARGNGNGHNKGQGSGTGNGAGKGIGQTSGPSSGDGQGDRSFSNNDPSGSGRTDRDVQNHMSQAAAYIKEKDYENAAQEYDKALEAASPDDARNRSHIYERQGWLALMDNDSTGAKELYLMAVDEAEQGEVSDQNLVNAYRGLAFCYEKSGDIRPAVANYKKALKLANDNTVKRSIKKKLQQLESKPKAEAAD